MMYSSFFFSFLLCLNVYKSFILCDKSSNGEDGNHNVSPQTSTITLSTFKNDFRNQESILSLNWRNQSGMNCDFEERCHWTWDVAKDSAQHGFVRYNGIQLSKLFEANKRFVGPSSDRNGNPKGYFLYILGKPNSEDNEISDKRIISSLLLESGNQCEVKIDVFYQDLEGAQIVIGIENMDNAYTPFTNFIMGKKNDTSLGRWKTLAVKLGRMFSPFRIYIEVRRHESSSYNSFFSIDSIRLNKCAPEDSGPIDCFSEGLPYKCPGGDGISCLKASSTLCDFKADCLNGEDELEKSCFEMPSYARCEFETFCDWKHPSESVLGIDRYSLWGLRSGPTLLPGGIKGDLSGNSNGKYLYYHYKHGINLDHDPRSVTLKSPFFPPPPKYNSNKKSRYYESCRIRLSYHRTTAGMMPGPIDVGIQWIDDSSNINGPRKKQDFKVANSQQTEKNMGWIRWEAKLPIFPQLRYQILLIGMGGIGSAEMEWAIDDFSLSPQCFGLNVPLEEVEDWRFNMTDFEFCKYFGRSDCQLPKKLPGYIFTTCGKTRGAFGPQNSECLSAYNDSITSVLIGSLTGDVKLGYTTGIQRWVVPQSGIYTIIVSGASGAEGRRNKNKGRGDRIVSILRLEINETLFILVGQMGESYCELDGVTQWSRCLSEEYTRKIRGSNNVYISSKSVSSLDDVILHNDSSSRGRKEDPFESISNDSYRTEGGGGGGGGASFVFKIQGKQIIPLIVSAGGGGASDQWSSNNPDAKGVLKEISDYKSLIPSKKTLSGSGAGWNESLSPHIIYEKALNAYSFGRGEKDSGLSHGFSMQNGWFGGLPCKDTTQQFGGFGGGGAGCSGGGGGGGFIGGQSGETVNENGAGGWSYVNMDHVLRLLDASDSLEITFEMKSKGVMIDKHEGEGQVQILRTLEESNCNCTDDLAVCVSIDEEAKTKKCICPNGIFLSHLNPQCTNDLPLLWMIAIIVVCVMLTAVIGIICMILYSQYQRRHAKFLRRKMFTGPDSQLNRLRYMNGHGGGLTEYNPNYEFGGGTYTLQDLKEIPRENLRLVRALGQGAFGEVYQGFYRKNSTDGLEISVAVKTLAELSSNQAEMDFLMEALIMSKFNHANIVQFIGVCFDKHPRFIILELLDGGDLKTFLRESRPKPDRPSSLLMKDLLSCAIDVAKGCSYLEENHFIHRDIAARNCLLSAKDSSRIVKIADFGMARDIYRADYYRKGGKTMLPVKWMPPEAFLDGIFTSKTDIWSFGILLWEVISLGYMPYPGRGNQEVMQLVTNGGRLEPPNYCPGPVYGLMCQCWHPIPEERPNFKTILERLGYCMQDPEVILAPLPMFHRPLSLESRDTSLSNSLSLRHQDYSVESGKGGLRSSLSTPESPPQTNLSSAVSSDYLIPLMSNQLRGRRPFTSPFIYTEELETSFMSQPKVSERDSYKKNYSNSSKFERESNNNLCSENEVLFQRKNDDSNDLNSNEISV